MEKKKNRRKINRMSTVERDMEIDEENRKKK